MDNVIRKPDFIAKCVNKYKTRTGEEKEKWTDIGVCFLNHRTESISIRLNALPIGGDMVLMKPKPKPEETKQEYKPFQK